MAPIIRVNGVSKDFLLPHLRQTTIKSRVLSAFRRSKTTAVQQALRDISFEVEQGEFLGVVGRNGSGKSTLLKILAGIYQPTSGSVWVGGRLVPFIELGVGFNGELTGRENVFLNGALLGFSKAEVAAMYDDIVSFAELEDSMDQKLKNYSSGMQVRIAFSVATRARADILLIDEVLAVGDAAFQRKCFEHFRALKKAGTTIVFVTHSMDAVRQFCDRAILIEDCTIVAEGSAEDVAQEYTALFTRRRRRTADPGQAQRQRLGPLQQGRRARAACRGGRSGPGARGERGPGRRGAGVRVPDQELQRRPGARHLLAAQAPGDRSPAEVGAGARHVDGTERVQQRAPLRRCGHHRPRRLDRL